MSLKDLDFYPQVKALRDALYQIIFFRGVFEDEIGKDLQRLLYLLTEAQSLSSYYEIQGIYLSLFRKLSESPYREQFCGVGDALQEHLLERFLKDENPLTRWVQQRPLESLPPAFLQALEHDLLSLERILKSLPLLKEIPPYLERVYHHPFPEVLVWWEGLQEPCRSSDNVSMKASVKRKLMSTSHWASLKDFLIGFFQRQGVGIFAEYRAFRWQGSTLCWGDGMYSPLIPVVHPDPIRLEEFFGYETQKRILQENTERFVKGFPANNALLYGDRGTGKSSLVKALFNRYAEEGLRLIELGRQYLRDVPQILSFLRPRPERFLLFIDDLSFEENETEYKELKALLEGSVEAKPANLVVYATSNRRHLVRESFSDRQQPLGEEDLHGMDTSQEKLSLSDRFGITLVFRAPNQREYLQIVEGLARLRGLSLPPEELHHRALEWALRYNGRSGRTARQFIDWLEGELKMRGY